MLSIARRIHEDIDLGVDLEVSEEVNLEVSEGITTSSSKSTTCLDLHPIWPSRTGGRGTCCRPNIQPGGLTTPSSLTTAGLMTAGLIIIGLGLTSCAGRKTLLNPVKSTGICLEAGVLAGGLPAGGPVAGGTGGTAGGRVADTCIARTGTGTDTAGTWRTSANTAGMCSVADTAGTCPGASAGGFC